MFESRQVTLEESLVRVHKPKISYESGKFTFPDQAGVLAGVSETISEHLKIPQGIAYMLSAETKEMMLKDMMSNNSFDALVDQNNMVTSLTWNVFNPPPTTEIIKLINDKFDLVPVKEQPGISRFSIFFASEQTFKVIDRDQVQFGIVYEGSVNGLQPTVIRPAHFRAVCTNGAYTVLKSVNLRWYGNITMEPFLRAASKMSKLNEEHRHKLVAAAVTPVGNPIMEIQRIAGIYHLDDPATAAVMDAYITEANPTVWGVSNAFTRAANTSASEISLRSASAFYIDHSHQCEQCHRPL